MPAVSESTAVPQRISGDIVFDDRGRSHRLLAHIGGMQSLEGDVYRAYQGSIKIFKPQANTRLKQQKIRALASCMPLLLCKSRSLCARIALPVSPVFADRGRQQMLGYLMRYFEGWEPLVGVRSRRTALNSAGRARLAYSLTELACFAEAEHLLLTDVLSFYNVLYHPRRMQAALIDLDSAEFVLGGVRYASLVGRTECFSPEHIGSADPIFLRSHADDVWALQLIIFELLAGCEPYAGAQGSSLAEDTRSGSYMFGRASEEASVHVPKRCAEAVKALPAALQDAFFDAFSAEGAHFRADSRFRAADWLALLYGLSDNRNKCTLKGACF